MILKAVVTAAKYSANLKMSWKKLCLMKYKEKKKSRKNTSKKRVSNQKYRG